MYDDRTPRILITRLSHVGDCIVTAPVVCALRAQFPAALIVWAVEKPSDQLLHGHEAVDELIVLQRGWLKSPRILSRISRRLKSLRLQAAVDPQSLTKSAVIARCSGARQRIGLARPQGRELAPLLNNQLVRATQSHVVDRSLELLQPLGVERPEVQFNLPTNVGADRTIEEFIGKAHLGCGFAVINPGAGWPSRLWSPRRFGVLARLLGQQRGLTSVVTWCGEQERCWGEQIVARSGGHALLAPQTNLLQLASLLRKSKLFIGCDTGPMHLAVATDTPCVVLHGTTRPEISGPYGPDHIAVQKYYQAGTSRQRRRSHNTAMMAIQVEEVCAACLRILDRHPAPRKSIAA